jgi:hypothetical protein
MAARASDSAARSTRADLSAANERLQQAAAGSSAPHFLYVVIDGVRQLLEVSRGMRATGFEREIDRFEADVRAGVRRLQDLVGCAQSEAQVEALAASARRIGFDCIAAALQYHAGNNLVGWRLALARP